MILSSVQAELKWISTTPVFLFLSIILVQQPCWDGAAYFRTIILTIPTHKHRMKNPVGLRHRSAVVVVVDLRTIRIKPLWACGCITITEWPPPGPWDTIFDPRWNMFFSIRETYKLSGFRHRVQMSKSLWEILFKVRVCVCVLIVWYLDTCGHF